jgi:hypothetical protein
MASPSTTSSFPAAGSGKGSNPGPAAPPAIESAKTAGQAPISRVKAEVPAAPIGSPGPATRALSDTGREPNFVPPDDPPATGQASAPSFWHWLGEVVGLTASSDTRGGDHIESGDVWLQPIDGGALRRLTSEGGYTSPVFAPDDQYVLALREGQLWKIPTGGGKPEKFEHGPPGAEGLLGSGPQGIVVLTADQIGIYSPKNGQFSAYQPVDDSEREAIAMMHSSGRAYGRGRPALFERNGVVVVIDKGHSREIAAGDADGVGSWSQPSASHDFLWVALVGTSTTIH